MDERPIGKEYAGPSGIGRDSIWLTAEDLIEGKDTTVKIASVVLYPRVKFQGGRERTNVLSLRFVGKERELGLNATNRKALNAMFGNISKAWKGQDVTLYVGETQMAGETVKCVRIRNRGSRAATAAEEFLGGASESGNDNPPVITSGKSADLATRGDSTIVDDHALFEAVRGIADQACAEFNGERPFIQMRPDQSGEWWLDDADLGRELIYSTARGALVCSRERLEEIRVKIADAAGIIG